MPEGLVECFSLDLSFYIHSMTSTKLCTTRLLDNQSVHHKGSPPKKKRPLFWALLRLLPTPRPPTIREQPIPFFCNIINCLVSKNTPIYTPKFIV